MKFSYLFFFCLIVMAFNAFADASDSTKTVQALPQSTCHDFWIAMDKFHHFTTSALLVCAGSAGVYQTFDQPRSESVVWGVGLSFSMGLGKEIRDMKKPANHFCWKDIAADLLGIAFGIWIMEQWK